MVDSNYSFPDIPEDIETAYRVAHRALEGLLPDDYGFVPETDLEDALEVISQFPTIASMAETVIIAYLGPEINWRTNGRDKEWSLVVTGADLDDGGNDLGFEVQLSESAFQGECGNWSDSPLDLAARAYKHEAGWDFPPGDAGVWLLMLAPHSVIGTPDEQTYFGRLAGFVILYDRDEDGVYESVGHMWTARAWRRRDIATRLLLEAKSRFSFTGIEGPLTKDSAALLKSHPELSGKPQGESQI
jgi:hypothetical protein